MNGVITLGEMREKGHEHAGGRLSPLGASRATADRAADRRAWGRVIETIKTLGIAKPTRLSLGSIRSGRVTL